MSEELDQDPGIPGRETVSDPGPVPLPDEKDEEAERREPLEDPDREGQLVASAPRHAKRR